MKSIAISEKDYSVVANKFDKFGLGYVRRVGNSIRIKPYNSFISDGRNNTIEFAIYLHETGYCWRRYTTSNYWSNEVFVYQMFRHSGYPDIWEHFDNIEQAIKRFEQYAIMSNHFYYTD